MGGLAYGRAKGNLSRDPRSSRDKDIPACVEQGRILKKKKTGTWLTSYLEQNARQKAKSRTPSREDKEEEERKRRAERKKIIVRSRKSFNRGNSNRKDFEDAWIRLEATHLPFPSNVEVMDRRLVRRCPCITLMPSLRWLVNHVDPPTPRSIR